MNISQLLMSKIPKSTQATPSTGQSSPDNSSKDPALEIPTAPTPTESNELITTSTQKTASGLPPRPSEKSRGRKRIIQPNFQSSTPPLKRTSSSVPASGTLPLNFSDTEEFGFLSRLKPATLPVSSVPVTLPGDFFCPGWGFNRNSRILTPSLAQQWLSEGVLPRDLDSLKQLSNEELINVVALSASQNAVLSARTIEVLRASEHFSDLRAELEKKTEKITDLEKKVSHLEDEAHKLNELESRTRQESINNSVALKKEQEDSRKAKSKLADEEKKNKELQSVNKKLSDSILVWDKRCQSLERRYEFLKGAGSSQTVNNFVKSSEFTKLVARINEPVIHLGYHAAIQVLQKEYIPHKTLAELGYDEHAGAKVDAVFEEITGGTLEFSIAQFVPSTPVHEHPEEDISVLEQTEDQRKSVEKENTTEQKTTDGGGQL